MDRHPTIRIHLLGAMQVFRSDGTSAAAASGFRTGKTQDLLRILALSSTRPVRPESVIERLWPDVTTHRARGSLRTALSQIRSTVGSNCITRSPEGLSLRDAWVDVTEFVNLTTMAREAARDGAYELVLSFALDAERLYVDDFHAHDDDSDWARIERERLRQTRVELLREAADSAVELGRFSEARDFAATSIRLDDSSESAHRTLMRAHAQLGDNAAALRVYETYRTRLVEEFGADPSWATRELHLRVLRGVAS